MNKGQKIVILGVSLLSIISLFIHNPSTSVFVIASAVLLTGWAVDIYVEIKNEDDVSYRIIK